MWTLSAITDRRFKSRLADSISERFPTRRGMIGAIDSSLLFGELAHAGPEHVDPDRIATYNRKQCNPDPVEDLELEATAALI